jgi:uncharacterized protein YdaU (DUF1376 family)
MNAVTSGYVGLISHGVSFPVPFRLSRSDVRIGTEMTLPFYPFYWGDYSAKTFDLTQGQHGAYMLFLRHVYAEGTPIPDKQRYSIAKALLKHEQENADLVLSRFFTKTNGAWVNNRASEVMEEAEEKHYRRVFAAQKPRKQCLSNGEALLKQRTSNALATRTRTILKNGPSVLKEGRKDKMAGTIPLDENSEAFKAWEAYLLKTKGTRPPRTDIRMGEKLVRGWYFPTEHPPQELG